MYVWMGYGMASSNKEGVIGSGFGIGLPGPNLDENKSTQRRHMIIFHVMSLICMILCFHKLWANLAFPHPTPNSTHVKSPLTMSFLLIHCASFVWWHHPSTHLTRPTCSFNSTKPPYLFFIQASSAQSSLPSN